MLSPYTQEVGSSKHARLGVLALCTLASAIGQTPAALERTPPQPPQPVEQFVQERLAVWQKRLSLEGWRISIVMAHRDELKSKTLGGIRWDKSKKSAVISVLDASDYRLPFREMLQDMEFTIIHELVHLELASLPRSEASRSSEEHAVNQLAEALLKLDAESSAAASLLQR